MRTMVFLNGWPDDPDVWKEQIKAFSHSYHCKTLQIPGFDNGSSHDFPEMRDLLAEEIRKCETPVILVGHDWGAYLAYMIVEKYPELVEKIITLDVGADVGPDKVSDSLMILTYQGILVSAWKLKDRFPTLAKKLSQGIARWAHSPDPEKVSANKNYIYYFFWRDLLFAKKNLLSRSEVSRPLLYLYAAKKRPMFQSQKWLEKIRSHPENRIEALPTGDHWFMMRRSDQVNHIISEWLQ